MPATVANFFSKLMFHIFRNEIWTITTNSLAKSTPGLTKTTDRLEIFETETEVQTNVV